MRSKRYLFSLSSYTHHIKVHIIHKRVFPFLSWKHKDINAWLVSHFLWLFSLSVCVPPMVYVDCGNATTNVVGAGCQKSCQTLDMECVSTDSLYLVESILIKVSFTITSYSWTLPAGKCFKAHFLYGPYSTKLTVSLAAYVLMIKCWMAKVAV